MVLHIPDKHREGLETHDHQLEVVSAGCPSGSKGAQQHKHMVGDGGHLALERRQWKLEEPDQTAKCSGGYLI